MSNAAKSLTREDALAMAERLQLIPDYPRGKECREASATQLQRLCRCQGGWQWDALTQASLLVDEAIATIPRWSAPDGQGGWPAIRAIANSLFKEDAPAYDIHAPQPGECPKCHGSGTVKEGAKFARCSCFLGTVVEQFHLDAMNADEPAAGVDVIQSGLALVKRLAS